MSTKNTKRSFNTLLNASILPALNTALSITANLYIGDYEEIAYPAIIVDYINSNPSNTNTLRDLLVQFRVVTTANNWVLADDIVDQLYTLLSLKGETLVHFNEYEYSIPATPTLTGNVCYFVESSGVKDIGKDIYPDLKVLEFEISIQYKI